MTQDVINQLLDISLKEIALHLEEKHSADPVVGIVIVHLPQEVDGEDGLVYHFHAARVFPSSPTTPNFVNPHYHLKGIEPYNILSGEKGEMNLGRVVGGKVIWNEPKLVNAGDLIEVQEGEVHSLRNTGEMPLDFTFACPDIHLIDNSPEHPGGDRYLTKDLEHGLPPQYPHA